jgi:hypothetical protein
MKTEIISVYASGDGRDKALELTEKTGAFCGLDHQSSLRLRLLSEELIELIRPFTDKIHGEFWLEAEDNEVQIHLKTDIPMDLQTRNELLAVSSSGKNSAAKGLMGKIREMIASVTLPDDPETKEMTDQAFSLISIGSQMGAHYDGAYSWSMTAYMNQVNNIDNEDGKAAQDELERSIVANLADEVTVSIVGSEVEVIIFKSYN